MITPTALDCLIHAVFVAAEEESNSDPDPDRQEATSADEYHEQSLHPRIGAVICDDKHMIGRLLTKVTVQGAITKGLAVESFIETLLGVSGKGRLLLLLLNDNNIGWLTLVDVGHASRLLIINLLLILDDHLRLLLRRL